MDFFRILENAFSVWFRLNCCPTVPAQPPNVLCLGRAFFQLLYWFSLHTDQAGVDEAKGDGEVVELEAYRQGTQKTELCNKWEGGACSCGGRCRFAHGLQDDGFLISLTNQGVQG
ncbi:hypothetical protein VPH35_053358 [Triticum aestivum]|uniref:C3H1-type domain-containing protein n=2 Tax=Triticum TaxID=4564 RepID=A0A9R1QN33_TRITD|nr:unnamed protein product [Triticum aestivum]VAH80431.1 unnamed protein product [Triticum turgidum subsp. durum]